MKLYPFELPEGIHPLAWTLLGFGLDVDDINRIASHLYENLGLRLDDATDITTTYAWQVSWPRPANEGRMVASIGETLDMPVPGGDTTAVRIVDGALPPGITLDRVTGRIVGTFTTAGLFQVSIRARPAVKYDPLGGDGSPASAGQWIPVDQPRQVVGVAPAPSKAIAEMTPQELEQLAVEIQRAQRARLIKEADSGN